MMTFDHSYKGNKLIGDNLLKWKKIGGDIV